ncbi:DUF397 domain-containing protein [Streptomyces sp. NPDC050509]|uniref:DUF397 domain-containing protein n=1 Tax=Streptomyces sp. NPDC050509 TaxID=3365620 RepID=UPI0037A8B73D
MATDHWQKSSYCSEGDACLSVAASPGHAIQLTETGDPAPSILMTGQTTWAGFLRSLKESHSHE